MPKINKKQTHMDIISTMIEDSFKTLNAALNRYTPVINADFNGIQESNLICHLVSQCIQKGYYPYTEASNLTNENIDGKIRVDLHIIGEEFVVTVEAKKLYSTEKAGQMWNDFYRSNFHQYDHDIEDKNKPHYIVILAISERDEDKEWWNNSHGWTNTGYWQKLHLALVQGCGQKKAITINAKNKNHHIMYLIKEADSKISSFDQSYRKSKTSL